MKKRQPTTNLPQTLQEAVVYFADQQRAHDHFVRIRWPHGVACPRMGCGSADVLRLKSPARPRFRCKDCKRDFTAKVGTIFEDSPIPLTKWLPAIWMIANCKNGISSMELHRALGVTQKTAWFMLHRIRVAMGIAPDKPLSGEIEADETFIGGKRGAMGHRSRSGRRALAHGPSTGKTIVFGMIQRSTEAERSKVHALVVPDYRRETLQPAIRKYVEEGSVLYTDAQRAYRGIAGYDHALVDHMIEFVNGSVHTNNIENFWSCLKRTVRGTYICPRPFHMQAYVEEQVFRFNEREENDAGRFAKASKHADNTRLTYKRLTRKA